MSIAIALIDQVTACGGRVSLDGDKLHMSAPKPLPAKLIEKLKANKPILMEYLRGEDLNNPLPLIPAGSPSPFASIAYPQDGPTWTKQRRNEILQEGQFTWFQICKLVYSEAIEAWCGQHWKAPSHGRCAACDKSNAEFNCGDGATVCRQDDYQCMIDYGTQRKLAAVRGLSQIGIEVPEDWILPDGSTP